MQTGLNVDSAPAHWACETVRYLEQATPFALDRICSHRTAQTSVWFTTRYGMSSSSEFLSCECVTLTKRSRAC